jgi:superfamily II DNA or RNA helicase
MASGAARRGPRLARARDSTCQLARVLVIASALTPCAMGCGVGPGSEVAPAAIVAVALLGVLFGVVAVVAWVAHVRSPLVVGFSSALSELSDVINTANAAVKASAVRDTNLAMTFENSRRRQANERLAAQPLEKLICPGIASGTIAALVRSGVRRITDVHGIERRRTRGVTLTRQHLLQQRLAELYRQEHGAADGLPAATLASVEERNLVRAALGVLDVNAGWSTRGATLLHDVRALRGQVEAASRDLGFRQWCMWAGHVPRNFQQYFAAVLGLWRSSPVREQAHSLAAELAATVPPTQLDALQAEYSSRRVAVLDLLMSRFHTALIQGRGHATARAHEASASLHRGAFINLRRLVNGPSAEEIAGDIERFELKPELKHVTLRAYQVFGAKFIACQRKVLLGDEMGLGKTLQALAVATHLKRKLGRLTAVALLPASLLENWADEIEKFTDLRCWVARAPVFHERWASFLQHGDIILMSYDTARARLGDGTGSLRTDLLICDEAHFVKTASAARTRTAQALADAADHVILLTGTPLENHVSEMVNILGIVDSRLARVLLSQGVDLDSAVRPEEFMDAVAPRYLRRTQANVLRELPPYNEVDEWLVLDDAHLDAYVACLRGQHFHNARQAAVLGAGAGSPKLERLKELCEAYELMGRKVLIFSFYLKILRAVRELFPRSFSIDGGVPASERKATVDAFGRAPGFAVLCSQIDTGGIGLNIQAASAVILMEPQLKPSTELQAIARAHRMGQKEVVHVHRLLTRDTLEQRLHQRLRDKSLRAQAFAQQSRLKDASREAERVEDIPEPRLMAELMAEEIQRHVTTPP